MEDRNSDLVHEGITLKQIESFPGYYAGEDGNIWSFRSGSPKILKGIPTHNGYFRICLYDSKRKGKIRFVQRLIAEAFHGPRPGNEYQASHEDGNRLNNKPDNLAWKTVTENHADKRRHGT